MASNETPEQGIERILQEHFSAEASGLNAPGDTWERLESRLGEQSGPRRFARFRNWFFPASGGFRTPAVAAAAVAVMAAALGVSVWLATNDGGEDAYYISGQAPGATTALQTPQERGPAGPQGEAGPTGSAGPQGEAGAAGAQGAASPAREATVTAAPRPTATPAAAMAGATGAPAAPTPSPQWVETQVEVAKEVEAEVAIVTPAGPAAAPHPDQPPAATTFQDYRRQDFVDARHDNVSTFSLDTDRTSYQLALNWAREGYDVDPASVRAEEWTNAFDYQYPPPAHDDRFAVTADVAPHPLHESMHLARVAVQAPEFRDDTPLNVTLVLDASGSMADGNRVAIAREAAETIRRSLDRRDRIAVVHFTDDVIRQLTVEHERPGDRDVIWSIGQLSPHGSTNVQAGLDLGVWLADQARRERPEAHNYVILMSDGVANVDATNPFAILESAGDPDGRPDSRNPLRIITIGVGIENYNDYLLEQIAQHGNGWYRYLSDIDQARTTFARDNWLALSIPFADQTRAQVTWDPETVAAWRIIGYENRVTPDETFTQDRKEFAEIPSGAATTVFYELELRDSRPRDGAKLGEVEVRWLTPKTGRSNSQHADIRAGRALRWTSASPMLRFGAIVALSADRYSGLRLYRGGYDEQVWRDDLAVLLEEARQLRGELGYRQAYHDFVFLLEHIAESARAWPPEERPSGYSR